jgi:hypothetical protein
MAERKGKGKAKRQRKTPKKRAPKAEQRKANGEAVKEDLQQSTGKEVVPWGHLIALEAEQTTGRSAKTAMELMTRNSEIFRGYLRGLSPETLAETYSLTPRSIKEIVAEYKKVGIRVTDLDAMEIIEDHILRVDAMIDELAAHSAREKGTGRTAAIRARLEAMRERIDVLQSVGVLPQDLGTIGVQLDLRVVGQLFVRALERRNLAEPSLLDELADIIEGRQDPDEVVDAEVVGEETLAA